MCICLGAVHSMKYSWRLEDSFQESIQSFHLRGLGKSGHYVWHKVTLLIESLHCPSRQFFLIHVSVVSSMVDTTISERCTIPDTMKRIFIQTHNPNWFLWLIKATTILSYDAWSSHKSNYAWCRHHAPSTTLFTFWIASAAIFCAWKLFYPALDG